MNVIFSIRLDKRTASYLRRLAKLSDRTRGDVVRHLIREAAAEISTKTAKRRGAFRESVSS